MGDGITEYQKDVINSWLEAGGDAYKIKNLQGKYLFYLPFFKLWVNDGVIFCDPHTEGTVIKPRDNGFYYYCANHSSERLQGVQQWKARKPNDPCASIHGFVEATEDEYQQYKQSIATMLTDAFILSDMPDMSN